MDGFVHQRYRLHLVDGRVCMLAQIMHATWGAGVPVILLT